MRYLNALLPLLTLAAILLTTCGSQGETPEQPMEIQPPPAIDIIPGDSPALPGADEIYPAVYLNGQSYYWKRLFQLNYLPDEYRLIGNIVFIAGDAPKEDLQFTAAFNASGKAYYDDAEPDKIVICLTTAWMADQYVIFDRGIDIHDNDEETLLQATPAQSTIREQEALALAKVFTGSSWIYPVNWEILDSEPIPVSLEAHFARNLLASLNALADEKGEPYWLFQNNFTSINRSYLAVGRKTGTIYAGTSGTNGKVIKWETVPGRKSFLEPKITANYSLENAKADGLVVYEDSSITSGQDAWDELVENTETGNPSKVRLAFYFTLGDGSHYAPELYEEIKDDYPALYIQDLSFDGEMYTLFSIEEGRVYTYSYKYLKRFEEIMNVRTKYSKRILYVLLNDNEKTWPQINWGMLSSQSTDSVDHKTVYTKYYLKE
jgi:hypothetical protein